MCLSVLFSGLSEYHMPGTHGEESVSFTGPRVTDGGWDLNSSPL